MTKQLTKTQLTDLMIVPDEFVDWLQVGNEKIPQATYQNARIALRQLGVPAKYDEFRDKRFVGGVEMTTDASGQVSDEACLALRSMVRSAFKFDPGKNHMWDALMIETRMNAYHPVKDYLEALKWDGKDRIGTWLINYLGVPDTPLSRYMSRLVLIASVRRVYRPGIKYDIMIILESPEGYNKSTSIGVLYGEQFFSDQSILGMTDKQLQEHTRGRWAIEASDLSGMPRAEVEKVKAQITRLCDSDRPAYGRARIDVPRVPVLWGTTNDGVYLRSQTGNRRFMPFKVDRILLEDLARDRDQLWAEAMCDESWGTYPDLMLPEELWAAAGIEQAKRTYVDPWLAIVERGIATARRELKIAKPIPDYYEVHENRDGTIEERLSSGWLLESPLKIEPSKLSPDHGKRLVTIMRKLGWDGPDQMRICGPSVTGYRHKVG